MAQGGAMDGLSKPTGLRTETIDALSVLRSLQDRGVSIWVADGQIRFRSPKGALGAGDLQNIRRLKEEIVALLGSDADDADALPMRRAARESIPLTPLQQLIWNQTRLHGRWP